MEIENHSITVLTEIGDGHSHSLKLKARKEKIVITWCDGERRCWDGHARELRRV